SFHIEEREKAALVGINGAGKSTLLKIIVGELTPDTGEVITAKGKSLGYLAQHQDLEGDRTIEEELLSVKSDVIAMEQKIRAMEEQMHHVEGAELEKLLENYNRMHHQFELEGGYSYRSEVYGVLNGLGFSQEDYQKKISQLSGGQKTRVALGRLLVTKPDIILLDEPTNHLDMKTKDILKQALMDFDGTLIVVSHDRDFLDGLVTKVYEFGNKKVTEHLEGIYEFLQRKKMENLNELERKN
ncbi:MAG TPA: ABC transporter, partial [Parabacteroides merdae]|nr:ABC transporter [Parabacteroides merdae]